MASDRWPQKSARVALATRFGLPYEDFMQDWEWEVADATRLPEFLTTYASGQLTDDERYSLMEIMIQCVEDIEPTEEFEAAWASLEPLLATNANFHRSSVEYWAGVGSKKNEGMFRVARHMHDLCKSSSEDN